MALGKQVVPVDITVGLDTGSNDFAASEGNALVRNGRYKVGKQIGKRNGASNQYGSGLPALTVDRNAIVELDGVPHVLTAEGTFRRDTQTGDWRETNVTAPRASRVVTSPLVRTNDALRRPECAVIGTLLCAVWEDQETDEAFYGFWDISEDTPRLVAGPKRFAPGNDPPPKTFLRVIAVESGVVQRFVVVGRIGTSNSEDLRQTYYDVSAADYTMVAATTLIQTQCVDGCVVVERSADGTSYYVASTHTGSNTRRLRHYNHLSASLAVVSLGTNGITGCLVHNSVTSQVVLLSINGLLTHIADDLSGSDTDETIFSAPISGAPFTFLRSALCLADSTTGDLWCARSTLGMSSAQAAYQVTAPFGTQCVRVDAAFAPSGERVIGGVVLVGGAYYDSANGALFTIGDQYANLTRDSSSTSNYAYASAPVGYHARPILVDSVAGDVEFGVHLVPCARFLQDQLTSEQSEYHLPRIARDFTFTAPATRSSLYQVHAVGVSSVVASTGGAKVDLVCAKHYRADPARNVTSQGLRVIGNGVGCTSIDGSVMTEMTPPIAGYLTMDGYDTNVLQATNVYAPSIPLPATYNPQFKVVWRWVDARGVIHRGPVSFAYIVPGSGGALSNVAGFGGYNPGKLCFPKCVPTGLAGDTFTVPEVEVYMFPGGVPDAEFRLVGIVPPRPDPEDEGRAYVVTSNNVGTSNVRYAIDATHPGTWSTGATLFTEGDEIEPNPTPPLLDIISTQSRLWALSGEGNRLSIWYTKPIVENYAPEWSPTLTITVPQEGGDVVALASLDDKIVALKKHRIYVIFGDPGDATGQGSTLQKPRLVNGDIGCVNVNSVVEGPFGVAWLSERGWYTLSRDLQLTYIGAPMAEAFATDWDTAEYPVPFVTTSSIVPSESEVRWVCDPVHGDSDERANLVAAWNYLQNKWSVWTSVDIRSLCVADGAEWRLGYVGLRKETPDVFASGAPVSQEVTTPWLKLNGLAGYQRLWRIVLVFKWWGGLIGAATSTDYLATEHTRTWTAETLETLVDPTTRRVELVVCPQVQKCEALKLHIAGGGGEGADARGFELIGCTLEIGTKKGAFKKLSAAARG